MAKSKASRENLFEASNDLSDAVLNWYGESIDKLDVYSETYRRAARSLLEKSSSDQLRDIGACPVVFLYRLSLELYLKAILISGSKILRLDGDESAEIKTILKKGHNLSELWNEFRKLYRRLNWKWDSDLDSVGRLATLIFGKSSGCLINRSIMPFMRQSQDLQLLSDELKMFFFAGGECKSAVWAFNFARI